MNKECTKRRQFQAERTWRERMPSIEIDESLYRQLEAFKPAFEAVMDEKHDWKVLVETVLHVGLTKLLMDIIGDPRAAVPLLVKLAQLEPEAVYRLIALTWEHGNEAERAELRRRIGFVGVRPASNP
jgi:hypothetical protein